MLQFSRYVPLNHIYLSLTGKENLNFVTFGNLSRLKIDDLKTAVLSSDVLEAESPFFEEYSSQETFLALRKLANEQLGTSINSEQNLKFQWLTSFGLIDLSSFILHFSTLMGKWFDLASF